MATRAGARPLPAFRCSRSPFRRPGLMAATWGRLKSAGFLEQAAGIHRVTDLRGSPLDGAVVFSPGILLARAVGIMNEALSNLR